MSSNSIACGIRHSLPDEAYYHFVNQYLRTQSNDSLDDPFMVCLPSKNVEQFYVPRDGVVSQILRRGCIVIVGQSGSGKTILWQSLGKSTKNILRVRLILNNSTALKQDLESFLAYHIFRAYRKRLLAPSTEITPHLSNLIPNPQWVNTFHRLQYHCHLRSQKRISGTRSDCENRRFFERSPSITSSIDVLRKLCSFIVHPPGYEHVFGKPSLEWPYKAIEVFLDCDDDLSDETFPGLIQSLQRICAMSSDIPDIKLFINRDQEALIDRANFSDIGFFYTLPPWRPEELYNLLITRLGRSEHTYGAETLERGIPPDILNKLREVLSRCPEFETDKQLSAVFIDARIAGWRYGLPEAPSLQARVNAVSDYLFRLYNTKGENVLILFLSVLSDLRTSSDQLYLQLCELINDLGRTDPYWLKIPVSALAYDARSDFVQIIVDGALRAYTQSTKFDAPIHALRLAHEFVAACIQKDQRVKRLDVNQLKLIVERYWTEEEKCDG